MVAEKTVQNVGRKSKNEKREEFTPSFLKKKMNSFELPTEKETKPQVAYSEMKLKVLITDIILKKDKNQKDYWVIRISSDGWNTRSFLAFSTDYNLSQKAAYLLMNPDKAINKMATLTIKKKNDKEKVIEIELEK